MAADLETESGGPISAINVTPFVDVALVLLVIFMVTAPALMKDVIGIRLPKAASSDTKAMQSFGIVVTRQGQILLNGQLVSPEALSAAAAQAVRANPETQAIVSADEDSRHGDVVHVIDLIKQAGLSRFALQIHRQQ